ncbi:MAG: hypothetical protein QXQ54_08055, partial [Thermoplasmata archaeon]
SFSAEAHEEWGWISGWGGIPYWGVKACYLTVSVVAKSVTGFTMVIIGARPLDKGEDTVVHVESIWSSTATVASYSNVRLDVDWWTLKVTGYRARAYALSYAEDMSQAKSVEASHEIKGIVTLIADALANLWQMLVSGLQEVWNAVEKAVNAIVEWVKQVITNAINSVLTPIKNAMEGFARTLLTPLLQAYEEYAKMGSIRQATLEAVSNAFLGPLYWALIGLSVSLLAVFTILMPITATIGYIISLILGIVVTIIVMGLFESEIGGKEVSGRPVWGIQEILNFARALVEGKGAKIENNKWDTLFGIMGALFGWQGFVFGGFIPLYTGMLDPTKYIIAGYACVVSVLGTLLGFVAVFYTGIEALLLGGLSLILSVMGLVSGTIAASGWIEPTVDVGQISLVMAIIGIALSVFSLRAC